MSDINAQIRKRIEAFVTELTALVRGAALDAVSAALDKPLKLGSARRPRRPGPVAAPQAPARARQGGKRSSAEIAATTRQLLEHVTQNPGQGVEQIAKALGTQSKALTLPIKRLVSAGKLDTKGHKRATKYFAAAGEAKSRAAASTPPARKAKRPAKRKSKSRRRKAKARPKKKR